MLLQTFIQLHILLAATPGLAGWTLFVPATQVMPAHVFYLTARSAANTAMPETQSRPSAVATAHAAHPPRSRPLSVEAADRVSGASMAACPSHSTFLTAHSPRAP